MVSDLPRNEHAFRVVGQLVVLAAELDDQLTKLCIAGLMLEPSPMLEPVVASLDAARKVELLKAYAAKLTGDWKAGLKNHLEAVEKVNRDRNTAAHSVLAMRAGQHVLVPTAAARLFKSMNLEANGVTLVTISELERGVKRAEAALIAGSKLLQHFERARTYRRLRKAGRQQEAAALMVPSKPADHPQDRERQGK